ncbi:uncharacterized protein [Nicotiana sylvestris]|uniref:uncharacterized protein n=1 Tax=Nicotiana sylvestris TaxID=4096 RepID=UPI00388CAD3F
MIMVDNEVEWLVVTTMIFKFNVIVLKVLREFLLVLITVICGTTLVCGVRACDSQRKAIPFHSLASSVTVFNGLNFSEWREQVQFHLGMMDLDLVLLNDKPAAITDSSSADEKSFYKAWERSNRLSIMFMRMNIANNIKSTIPQTESDREYLKFMEERFPSVYKSLAGTLMAELTTMEFDGLRSMQNHIIDMTSIAAKLQTLGMKVDDSFLVQFILNSLPPEYGPFQINYNIIKDKWNVSKLSSMLT